ncbi:MAG: glutamyl-tRNA reductase [Deltaproteobacteria bacterium]|nr:glutamyl-tRNA reductase [Deltaproteobacteria bacterium]
MGKATLFILGLNHRTAPVAVRERLAYAEAEIPRALASIKQRVASVSEVAILSTCNRVEMVGVAADSSAASGELAAFIAEDRRVGLPVFAEALYRIEGREAARHLFRVGASLDSMMVGEPQILGQLKLAYAQAARAGTVGLVLHRAFHKAFSTAKRIRKGTLIGHGAVSASSAAVALARQIFDRLSDKTVMLMGAGKMAELTARQLQTIGIESLLITSRTFDNAVTLARELGGTAVPFDNYRPYLKIADVVIGSISVTKPIIGPDEFDAVIRERRYRPMFLIDLGVPRNFDERLNSIENVYLYDIDDLGQVADKSRAEREREADKGEEIVEQELKAFEHWMAGLDLVPTIKDIRYSIERLRDVELGRNQSWIATLGPSERERVELLTRSLTNKLLHRILLGLRQGGNSAADNTYAAEVARRLLCGEFDLEDSEFDAIEDDDEP